MQTPRLRLLARRGNSRIPMKFSIVAVLASSFVGGAGVAAEDFRHGQPPQPQRDANLYAPDLTALAKPQSSELRELVERFVADRDTLAKYYSVPGSMLQLRRFREFYQAWQTKLEAMPYESLGVEGRIDWHLMRLELRYQLGLLARAEKRNAEMAPFMGFADAVAGLQETRRQFDKVSPEESAAVLVKVRQQIE